MKTNNLLIPSFILGLVITLLAALLKIMHVAFADTLLALGLLLTAVYVILAIIEVTNSNRIDKSEKWMWVIGFLFLGTLAGLVYVLSGRKRVI